tara:strand:+ start:987 stop:1229 length:243 start_codon:yes stop_codon:yes gene_type:complete
MKIDQGLYRLVRLDGSPHPVLDAPYDSMEAALGAATRWCEGQGLNCSLEQRAIGIEVLTRSGSWRTIRYPRKCLSNGLSF